MLTKARALKVSVLLSYLMVKAQLEKSPPSLSCKTGERILSRKQVRQAEITGVLLLNGALYGTGSLCVLMRRPWTGGKARGERGAAPFVMVDDEIRKDRERIKDGVEERGLMCPAC